MYNAINTIDGHQVTIRQAAGDEWDAIDRLAQLDSAPPPPREQMLVAEIGGDVRAAVSVRDDYAIANPFEHSSQLIELLRARAAQLRHNGDATMNHRNGPSVFSFGWLRSPHRSQAR